MENNDSILTLLELKYELFNEYYLSTVRVGKMISDDKFDVVDRILDNMDMLEKKIDNINLKLKDVASESGSENSKIKSLERDISDCIKRIMKKNEQNQEAMNLQSGINQSQFRDMKKRVRVSNAYKKTEDSKSLFYDMKK